jgi:3-dehydroquinate dehydratase-2
MILILNGPNLNMLGKRDNKIYGKENYEYLKTLIYNWGEKNNFEIEIFQSNHEGEIIDRLQKENYEYLIINPGAFTHYSIAIRDCLEIIKIPKIEVHISNIYSREEFRRKSLISEVCDGVISGFGIKSYLLALENLIL